MTPIASDRRAAGKRRRDAVSGGFALLALVLTLLAIWPGAARAEIDPFIDARRFCRTLLPAFAEQPIGLVREPVRWLDDGYTLIAYRWEADRAVDGPSAGWLACWFLPMRETGGRWQIDHLETSKYGVMTRYDVQQLYKLLHLQGSADETEPVAPAGPELYVFYSLQQAINAISVGCLYGLIAVGFTLVFRMTGIVNFSYGALFTLGAFQMLLLYLVGDRWLGDRWIVLIPAIVFSAAAIAGLAGWASERVMLRSLHRESHQAGIIATVGLLIALQEGYRLLQGAKTRWLPVDTGNSWRVIDNDTFDVYVSRNHVIVAGATVLIAFVLWFILKRLPLGRAMRAAAEDARMAMLLGVDPDRTVGASFLIGGALAGIAGAFTAIHYGPVNFHMGLIIGFKALTASIVGGIGSVPGALLGGMLVAMVEAGAAITMGSEWREIAVFGLLAVLLIFRPRGLLGPR